MSTCGDCGGDLEEGTDHLHIDCVTNLQNKVESLETQVRGFEEATDAYKRHIQKLERQLKVLEERTKHV